MKKLSTLISTFLLSFIFVALPVKADSPTDEIRSYEMTVSINEDATANINYHIEWEVLESDGIGPLSWVTIGIPNAFCDSYEPLSQNIDSISYDYSGGHFLRIDFDRDYYEGEVISFDFNIVQDYMYEVDNLKEGETYYYFTPGWFDEIKVDSMIIKWDATNALSYSSGALLKEGYLTWEKTLEPGETFEVYVSYNTEDYSFTDFNYSNTDDEDYYNYSYSYDNGSEINKYTIIGFFALFFDLFGPIIAIAFFVFLFKFIAAYNKNAGLSSPTTKKQIKRTLIKYYPMCPGCGAAREEGKEYCEYCGRCFIESEEVIEEKDIVEPKKYSDEGIFKYNNDTNTYVRVHVTHVPIPKSTSSKSSCAHSSCAHSSCACAHSCACACACACAGGGRAGCSTKDFYKTSLKLDQLRRKAK